MESETEQGNHDMHELARQARALMEAAEGVDGVLAQQRLEGRHQQVLAAARAAAAQIGSLLETGVKRGELEERRLFEPEYLAVSGTNPTQYRTDFDEYTDRHFPGVQEPLLSSLGLAYAISTDRQGYVPTHNRHVSEPPNGDYEHDLKLSRSKRIYDDPTGSRCGAHQEPLLLQTYKRDTGEIMHDLSVPVFVNGKHWGGFRVGYKPESA